MGVVAIIGLVVLALAFAYAVARSRSRSRREKQLTARGAAAQYRDDGDGAPPRA